MKKKVIIVSSICFVIIVILTFMFSYKRNINGKQKVAYYYNDRQTGAIFARTAVEKMRYSKNNKMNWNPIDTSINIYGASEVRVNSSLTNLEYYYLEGGHCYYFNKGYTWLYGECDTCYIEELKKYKLPQTPKQIYDKYHNKLKNKGRLITTWDRFVNGTVTLDVFEIIEKREYLISIREDSKRFLVLYMNDKMYYFKNEKKPVYEAGYFVILKNKGLKVDK